jgi:hypothetical protein
MELRTSHIDAYGFIDEFDCPVPPELELFYYEPDEFPELFALAFEEEEEFYDNVF